MATENGGMRWPIATKWLQTLARKTIYSPFGYRFCAQRPEIARARTVNCQHRGLKQPKQSRREIDGQIRQSHTEIGQNSLLASRASRAGRASLFQTFTCWKGLSISDPQVESQLSCPAWREATSARNAPGYTPTVQDAAVNRPDRLLLFFKACQVRSHGYTILMKHRKKGWYLRLIPKSGFGGDFWRLLPFVADRHWPRMAEE